MTAFEIEAKIKAIDVKIQKKKGTLSKNEAKVEKLIEKAKTAENKEFAQYDIEWAKEAVEKNKDDIEKMLATRAKYEERLNNILAAEAGMPECLKNLRASIEESWNEYDIEANKAARQEIKDLGYDGFIEKYGAWKGRTKYRRILDTTEENIRKKNRRNAENFVTDLKERVTEYTGNVTNWDNIAVNGSALNGIVEGEKGKAKVESILAGGYNIQRLHIRVLVHPVK